MPAANRKSSVDVKVFLGTVTGEGKESVPSFGDKALDNVSDIPDLGAAPEQIEVTAIGDQARKYIAGILETDELEFTCFYEKDAFETARNAGRAAIKVAIDTYEVIIIGEVSATLSGFGVGDAISYTMKVQVEDIQFPAKTQA